jgi:hypothetical protein
VTNICQIFQSSERGLRLGCDRVWIRPACNILLLSKSSHSFHNFWEKPEIQAGARGISSFLFFTLRSPVIFVVFVSHFRNARAASELYKTPYVHIPSVNVTILPFGVMHVRKGL